MVAIKHSSGINSGNYMLSAKSVASYFIHKSSQSPENDLTNLKLQKLLFFAQAESARNIEQRLFKEDIEAWRYGPVVVEVYDWLKGCGAYPITAFDIPIDTSELTEEHQKLLSNIWNKYGKYSAGYLVDKTHEIGTPWHTTFSSSSNKVIPYETISTTKLQEEW